MRRVVTGVVAVAFLAGLATIPALAASPSSTPAKKAVLTIGTTNEIDSLNPFVAVEAPSYETFWLEYDILTAFSQKDLSPAPGLAERWEHTPDGLTWTYHLRHDAKWSDGQPLTSADVKYTFDRVLAEKSSCCIGYLSAVESIDTPDRYTVILHTKTPSNQMQSLWVNILPEHIWKNVPPGKAEKSFENENTVGSGPFQVVEWQKGQFWRLQRNPYYWGKKPAVDEVIFREFNNDDAMVQALKKGEIDAAENIPPNLFRSLQGEKDITQVNSYGFGLVHIGFNTGAPQGDGNPALRDVRVRQAIEHAIDRKTLFDKVMLGYGKIGGTLVPPGLALYHLDLPKSDLLGFAPEESKRLLAEAGYRDTDGNGIVDKGGQDLVLRYYTRSERADSSKEAQFISAWLKDVGIGTKVKAYSDNTLTDVITAGDFDIFSWGWGSDPTPDFILSVVTCGQRPPHGIWSDTYYCNKTYDKEYFKQKTILDPNEQAKLIKKMQRQIWEASPYVILYYDPDLQAYRNDHFTGWVHQPEPGGPIMFSYGPYSYINVHPTSATSASGASSSSGLSPVVWIAVVAGAILLIGGVMLVRRRVGAEERE